MRCFVPTPQPPTQKVICSEFLVQSGIHGWGLLARKEMKQDSMIIEYRGEALRRGMADLREKVTHSTNPKDFDRGYIGHPPSLFEIICLHHTLAPVSPAVINVAVFSECYIDAGVLSSVCSGL